MVCQRLRLYWQILKLWSKVMESVSNVYKLWRSQIVVLKPYRDGKNLYIGNNNVKVSCRDSPMGILRSSLELG